MTEDREYMEKVWKARGTQYTTMQNLDRDIEYVEKYIETCKYLSPEHRIALIADAALLKLKALSSINNQDVDTQFMSDIG
jgi:hypothetical protein